MLNISHNKVDAEKALRGYKAFEKLFSTRYYKMFNRFLLAFAIIGIVFLFLPWTQNVTGNGYVTTLTPDQRPQTRDAKNRSVNSYAEKVKALNNQILALNTERRLKIQQTKNKLKQKKLKVISDSIDLEAVRNNSKIAETQYKRTVTLNEEGLKAITDVEAKRLKLQEMTAKLISQENKLLTSKNEVINAEVEISRISTSYADKIAKAQSDRSTAESNQFEAEAQVNKLSTQSANYKLRNEMYYIKAP